MPKTNIDPYLGEPVIYVAAGSEDTEIAVNGATEAIAFVCRIFDNTDSQDTKVNLRVFPDSQKTPWRTGVPYDADKKPHTWHRPND